MLMKNECSSVPSIRVKLTFDSGSEKERVISPNDLIEVEYNANGLRKHIIGKVAKISTVGTDPSGWYIIVDGSDDFASEKARFSPMAILDVDIIRKAYTLDYVQTPFDETAVPYLRLYDNKYLQFSRDGIHWKNVFDYKPRPRPNGIEPAVYPVEYEEKPEHPHHHHHIDFEDTDEYDNTPEPDDTEYEDNEYEDTGHCGCNPEITSDLNRDDIIEDAIH